MPLFEPPGIAGLILCLTWVICRTEGVSTNAPPNDEEKDEVLSKAMLIGLSVGFGSLCGVIIICCVCFKCCDCSNRNERRTSAERRKVAWK